MKKTSVLIVLALFILSMVPMIAAEDTTATDDTSVTSETTSGEVEDTTDESTDSQPEPTLISANPAETEDSDVSNFVKENKDKFVGKVEDCVDTVKEKFPEAKETIVKLRCSQIVKLGKIISELPVEQREKVREEILDAREQLRTRIGEIKEGAKIKFENMKEEQAQKLEKLSDDEMKKLSLLDRARVKKIASLGEAQMKIELAKMKIVEIKKDMLFKKREVSQDKIKKAKKAYETADSEYEKAKDQFESEKAKFEEFKGKDEAKALEHAKKFLNHAGDVVIKLLEKVKSKTQENEGLTANEASKIVADIDARITAVKAAQEKVSAATTKEEVKQAGKAIIEEWTKTKSDVKEYVGRLVNAKVGEIIERSEQLEKKLNDVLTEMKNNSISIDSINTKVDLFSMRVEEARNKFKTAQSLFEQVKAMKGESMTAERLSTIKSLSEQANALAKEAHSALREAHSILMTIVKDVKQAGGEVSLDTEAAFATVEVVQDVTATETEDVEESATETNEQETEDSEDTTVDTTEQEDSEAQNTTETENSEDEDTTIADTTTTVESNETTATA